MVCTEVSEAGGITVSEKELWDQSVTIGVRACPDHLLTSYGYGIRCVTMY